MQGGKVHHIELYVSDLQISCEFWGWFLTKLGYEKFQEWNEGISWKLDDTYIVFVQTQDKYKDIKFHRCRTGLNHVAFRANSEEQVDSLTQELIKRGINILYKDRYPHAGGKDNYAVYFEDPDRIKIELVAP
jgi:catechol 2,3-dioxygenase-like lactoylglutathione lyase family enzyme